MDTATVVFLVIGGLGVLLLALSLIGVDLPLEDFVPLEAVAAGLGVFGFATIAASTAMDRGGTTAALLTASGIGLAAAIPSGWLALRLSRAVRRMRTDATPTRSDLLGTIGVVVTPIPAQGYGEVRITLGGQPVKLNARSDQPLPLGTRVFVIQAPSETSVLVEQVPGSPSPS